MKCKHCGKPIRLATKAETDMLTSPAPIEWKHVGDMWGCGTGNGMVAEASDEDNAETIALLPLNIVTQNVGHKTLAVVLDTFTLPPINGRRFRLDYE